MRHEFKNTPYLHVIDKSKWQRNIKSSLNNWTDSQSCWFEFVVNEENSVHRKWNQMVKMKTYRFQSEQSQHDHRKYQFYSKFFYFIGFKNHVFFFKWKFICHGFFSISAFFMLLNNDIIHCLLSSLEIIELLLWLRFRRREK